jgi:hypothetical protein
VAGTYDIYCDQGATFRRVITWKNSTGTAVNLTGYTARMMVRTSYAASTPALSLTSSPVAGIAITAATGVITITITPVQSSGIAMPTVNGVRDAFDGVYDLELVAPSGDVTRLLEGRFICSPEATR